MEIDFRGHGLPGVETGAESYSPFGAKNTLIPPYLSRQGCGSAPIVFVLVLVVVLRRFLVVHA